MTKKESASNTFGDKILKYFPEMKEKLMLADMKVAPEQFLSKAANSALMFSLTLLVLSAFLLVQIGVIQLDNFDLLFTFVVLSFLFLIYLFFFFFYFKMYPEAKLARRRRQLDYEIVFGGRHLVIALKSGMPLFDAMVGVSQGYGAASEEFSKIVQKISAGTPMTQAIREVAQINPSNYCVRVFMQISNSLSSGADLGNSLDSVLDQISKEQLIQLREYGQKLTPMVMFFMVFGIILPSIGVVLATVLFSVISGGNIGLPSSILLYIFAFIAVVQFLFLGVIESSRPKYLL
ncbi:MAG: type II secretion system F family protein [Candidatus Micrarchaeota archaeon]